jgi:alkylhydroperoxidase family enzyme
MRIVPHMPTALRLDMKWQRGVPGKWPQVGAFLRERTGHEFPLLAKVRHGRAVKSVASMLRESLDPATTVVGLPAKVLAGVVFAEVVADQTLASDVRALAPKHGVTGLRLNEAKRFATDPDVDPPGEDVQMRAALLLARAASPSPAEIDAGIVAACREATLSSPAIVELVTWLAVLQTLHRLSCYYGTESVRGTAGEAEG